MTMVRFRFFLSTRELACAKITKDQDLPGYCLYCLHTCSYAFLVTVRSFLDPFALAYL